MKPCSGEDCYSKHKCSQYKHDAKTRLCEPGEEFVIHQRVVQQWTLAELPPIRSVWDLANGSTC